MPPLSINFMKSTTPDLPFSKVSSIRYSLMYLADLISMYIVLPLAKRLYSFRWLIPSSQFPVPHKLIVMYGGPFYDQT
jgi:hypothetical protein